MNAGDAGTLTAAQDAALDRLAEAIAEHVKGPCAEAEPCIFHRALIVAPSGRADQ